MMNTVYLSLGSNIDRERYIVAALDALQHHFGQLVISSIYESLPVGFDGSNFYNLVVVIETDLALADLSKLLRQIEADNNRCRRDPKFGPRTLDIDILLYGDCVGTFGGITLPRGETTKNAFVLLPLAEIAPNLEHLPSGKTYGQLWAEYDTGSQKLWPVDFIWQGKILSKHAAQ